MDEVHPVAPNHFGNPMNIPHEPYGIFDRGGKELDLGTGIA
jgi:hypothetical protein